MEPIQDYFQLLAQLDRESERLARLYGPQLECRPGCSSCCTALTLLPIEAEAIRRACSGLPAAHQELIGRQAKEESGCPLLDRRRCLIYPARPVICRTHGLPVAYVDPSREVIEVSACPVNFPPEYPFDQEGLLYLDGFNEQLRILSERLTGAAPPVRIPVRECLGAVPRGQAG